MKKTVTILAYENTKTNEVKLVRDTGLPGILTIPDYGKNWVRALDLDQSREIDVPEERKVWRVNYDFSGSPTFTSSGEIGYRTGYVREVKDIHKEIVVDLDQLQKAWDECEKQVSGITAPAQFNVTFTNFLIRLGVKRR